MTSWDSNYIVYEAIEASNLPGSNKELLRYPTQTLCHYAITQV